MRTRRLFTVGAVPTRPETGYGYIRIGSRLSTDDLDAAPLETTGYAVGSFVEKPDRDRAQAYLASGDYLWNTGLFVWRVADLLDQLERHTPELAPLIPILREGGVEEFFRRAPPLSIDEGLLERSERVGVVRASFDWDDVGAWDAVFRARETDEAGNALVGEAWTVDTRRSVLYADDGPIVAFGIEDLIIVRSAGVTFVTHRERAAEMKSLLAHLPVHLRTIE